MSAHPYKRSHHGESSRSDPTAGEELARVVDYARTRAVSKETKRMRGEIACAECRRLKIRCDRNVPCSTCVKRGCSALCPNETIPPGEGSRFVLAATDHLRQKMTGLEARMHALEDALAIIHATESDEPHPLLTMSLYDEEDDEPKLKPIAEKSEDAQSSLADALGMLHIESEHGAARFFGPSGGSESLLLKAKELEAQEPSQQPRPQLQELDPSYLPQEINVLCQSFPFSPPAISPPAVQHLIESFLPPMERAIELSATFLEHLSWMFQIVTRKQIIEELIPVIYTFEANTYGPHDLSLMLIVLAIGALVDLDLPPYNLEAQHYYRLARAALNLQPPLGQHSVVTIKVLHLMSIYNGMSGKESNLEQSYTLLNFAGRVAVGIGFHIDPSFWGFTGKEAYERRAYFWNLLAGILWQSMVTGRPPIILQSYIDCKMPTPEEEDLYQQGEVPLGFGIWGFRGSQECLLPAVRATLAAKPPRYSTILELDRKIRDFASPASVSSDQNDRIALSMRTFVRSHYQDLILLFLHRGYFAQAMSENPEDPLKSPYGKSMTAAYQSACVVLEDIRLQFIKKPLLCARVWRMWSHAFSAAVIIGAVAIHGPQLCLEPPAFEQFEVACLLFRKAAETSSRAARALPILYKMREKALGVQVQARSKSSTMDELAIFAGRISGNRLGGPLTLGLPTSPPTQTRNVPPSNPQARQYQAPGSYEIGLPSINHPCGSEAHAGEPRIQVPSLPQGWDSLYCEIPGPSHSAGDTFADSDTFDQSTLHGAGPMLDDRWSTFMHSYGIMPDPHSGQY